MKIVSSLLSILLFTSLVGCSSSSAEHRGMINDINHTPAITSMAQLRDGTTGLFVYRTDLPKDTAAINVFVDEAYFASLLNDSYRFVTLCPGIHSVNAVYHYDDPAYEEKLEKMRNIELNEGEVAMIKVTANQKEQILMQDASFDEVEDVLDDLVLQDFTLSRVLTGQNCQ